MPFGELSMLESLFKYFVLFGYLLETHPSSRRGGVESVDSCREGGGEENIWNVGFSYSISGV